MLSHAYHAHVLLFMPDTVLSQSVLLGLRFIHNSVFSLPPPFYFLTGTLFSAFIYSLCSLCIFSTTRMYTKQIIILFLYIYICIFQSFVLWYYTRSHSSVRFRGCETTVLLPNKSSGREVQPRAALYPTVRLSPWRQVWKNKKKNP